MKKLFVFAMLMSLLQSCQESKENAGQKLPKQYDRRVGEQIPLEVANRWANNFTRNVMAGRTSSIHSIDAAHLTQLVSPIEDRLGVVLHHVLDDANHYRLFMYALDQDGELFKNTIFDLASGETINELTAKDWADNYAKEHPTTPWYHFFGSDVFTEILSNPEFDYAYVERGLNENNEEQVLLFVYNTKGYAGGRSEDERVVVYDFTEPCPPCSSN